MQESGKKVVMDLDAVLDFIFCPEEKRDVDVNIEENYVKDKDEIVLSSKTRRENKTSNHAQHETIRYDLFRRMYDSLDDMEWDEEGNGPFYGSMGNEICFNTLVQYGFIKEI